MQDVTDINTDNTNISVAVLSGGQGRRFGTDKTLAVLSGKKLFDYPLDLAISISEDIMFISRDREKYKPFRDNIRYLEDDYSNQSAMAGILTALKRAIYDRVFVIPADMPLVNKHIAEIIISNSDGYDIAIPKINNKLMLLFAVYDKKIEKFLLAEYNKGNYRLFDLLPTLNINILEEDIFINAGINLNLFININQSTDLDSAESILNSIV